MFQSIPMTCHPERSEESAFSVSDNQQKQIPRCRSE
jgi:hypothetical protein